ncbi:MAG: FAD-dependent oxidoreductase [Actinomycetia bacterium]|nr:FAD-dependent oxidoreductase [Actinomycetes bacterium]MCP4225130.1 FAD-dependent oxidoreductase [Actinomycetes bacterium]MCP5033982.1 FAD-dependent oxidoreductase [Actinomycetes bacterium]
MEQSQGATKRFVIIGGGPAGTTCATHASRMGADVVLIERDIVGGAAHLLDCIPSKAMIATGEAMARMTQASEMGLARVNVEIDFETLRSRISDIEKRLEESGSKLLASQGVRIIEGTGRLLSDHQVEATTKDGATEVLDADVIVLSTGSRPRIPDWADVDGVRVLTTRDAYPPPELPDHLVVVGSGVTGVEFVHMFNSFGSEVSLIVSRRQVLPDKDPEVAAVLEQTFIDRGVKLLMGARATGIEVVGDRVRVQCDDGRVAEGSHVLLAIGSIPNSEGLGLEAAGLDSEWGYVNVDHNCRSNVPHIYAAGDLSGRLPLSSVASTQGRKIAEHAMGRHTGAHRHIDYDKAASAIFTDPEIADVGVAEADAFAEGRKIRVTKVPFSVSAKALINNDSRGFVKIVSDPATGVVIGGSIVGRHAAELISVLALAVSAGLTVTDLVESLFVHPALAEALGEAAI